MNKKHFSNAQILQKPVAGILFATGEKWRAIRKLTTVAFRDFGVGSRTLEHIIQEEAQTVCDAMAAKTPFSANFTSQ